MKNWKKMLPNPALLLVSLFILTVMIATWGEPCPFEVFCVFGPAALPVFFGILISGMLAGTYLVARLLTWYDDWRER